MKQLFKMAFKHGNKQQSNTTFTPKEAQFIISKLRLSQYSGTEFESFYTVVSKLQEIADSK